MAGSRSLLAAFALALCGASAAWLLRSGYADDAKDAPAKVEETVAAKRYKTWVFVEAGRGGMWIEELYFPEKGVCANVEWRLMPEETHALNAFHSPMRNRYSIHPFDEKQSESPVEDVKVPAALAQAIFETAEFHRQLEQARHDTGAKVSGLGLCRDLDSDGKPWQRPVAPAMK